MSFRATRSRPGRSSWNRRSAIDAPVNRRSAVESGPIAISVAFATTCVPAERTWFRMSAKMIRFFWSIAPPARPVREMEAGVYHGAPDAIS